MQRLDGSGGWRDFLARLVFFFGSFDRRPGAAMVIRAEKAMVGPGVDSLGMFLGLVEGIDISHADALHCVLPGRSTIRAYEETAVGGIKDNPGVDPATFGPVCQDRTHLSRDKTCIARLVGFTAVIAHKHAEVFSAQIDS